MRVIPNTRLTVDMGTIDTAECFLYGGNTYMVIKLSHEYIRFIIASDQRHFITAVDVAKGTIFLFHPCTRVDHVEVTACVGEREKERYRSEDAQEENP